VSDEMLEWKSAGTRLYQELPAALYKTLRACEPLREIPADRPVQQDIYKTWKSNKH
jgi:phenylacetic acid degradation protein